MVMIDFYIASVAIFVVMLAIIVVKDRKNFTRESKVILLRKTQKGKRLLVSITERCPRFWKWLGTIGVAVSIIASVYGVLMLLNLMVKSFFVKKAVGGLALLLPTPTATPIIAPGLLAVPFWYWIISIGLLVLVHEGLHGIMAVRERVPVKSMGWGLLAVLPLAFVEPDEKVLQRKKPLSQLRVFAAGSFANFILAGIVLVLAINLSSGLMVPYGVDYLGTTINYSADKHNMTGVIIGVNNYDIRTSQDLSDAMEAIGPGKEVWVLTTNGTDSRFFILNTTDPPNVTYHPDLTDMVTMWMEHIAPGTIDFSGWAGEKVYEFGGGQKIVSWGTIKDEINKWEYVNATYPGLREKAETKLFSLNAELAERNDPGYLGIAYVSQNYEIKDEFRPYKSQINFAGGLMFFLILINLGVGVANMLPIKPLDGGRVWEIIFRKFFGKKLAKRLTDILGWATLLLIIMGFVLPFVF
jgi:membrane-associated protease RseP (regulator of RpoE activity)